MIGCLVLEYLINRLSVLFYRGFRYGGASWYPLVGPFPTHALPIGPILVRINIMRALGMLGMGLYASTWIPGVMAHAACAGGRVFGTCLPISHLSSIFILRVAAIPGAPWYPVPSVAMTPPTAVISIVRCIRGSIF